MTIGFDYFQVLAIFARINVKWPPWVKSLLELASFLNFNIDIAGPECAFPKFDYKIKWIVTVVTPFMFGFLLFLIFLLLMCWKFIQKICSLKSHFSFLKEDNRSERGHSQLSTFSLVDTNMCKTCI